MRQFFQLLGGGVAILAALALAFFTGCDSSTADGYEAHVTFPPRQDPIILDLSAAKAPLGLHPLGKLHESILALKAQGAKVQYPSGLKPYQQQNITNVLTELFGTPASPVIMDPHAAPLGLTPERLAAGSRLYKHHCVQCHGMTGDGRGPTSQWTYPPARDFRKAVFKFVSTQNGQGWPTRDDLNRVIRRGLSGTPMPSFAMLNEGDLNDVVSYTLYLMIRGKIEHELIVRVLEDPPNIPLMVIAQLELTKSFKAWQQAIGTAKDPANVPTTAPGDPSNADAIRRGHAMFVSEKASCTACHVEYGRRSLWQYDVWGVAVKPATLTEGQYRGGREPLDLFRLVKCGIPGVKMPAANQYRDEQLWDLVAFLQALPDPKFLPDDVRKKVYPNLR